MIEFTEVVDPYGHRYETRRTMVILDHVKRVIQNTGRNSAASIIEFTTGDMLYVAESIDAVEKRVHEYAEAAQKERIAAMVKAEVERLLPEMAEKAWMYEDTSK